MNRQSGAHARSRRPAGIKDIAKALGVSTGTVDRALHARPGINDATRRRVLKMADKLGYRPNLAARVQAYEIAYRLQSSAPELMNLGQEPKHVLDMYGVDPAKPGFARNCLLARRLIERGVRFVQLFHEAWDQHGNLKGGLTNNCRDTDRASAALIKDLKQRGLLEDTLVIWGGEFGRTPMVEHRKPEEADNAGRDHHPSAFSMWMAGGGFRGGYVHGATDDLCLQVTEKPVHVHDLQATMLHSLGFDHTKLTYRHMGRDFRLTDVEGEVIRELLA
jgi:uncharacterized protein (DUF1501 family)